MLLSIDEAKVRESLKLTCKPEYVITSSHLAPTALPPIPHPSLCIGGTIMVTVPSPGTDVREYILSLRRDIVDSGTPLKTVEELEAEIDEIKGRGGR